MRSIKTVPDQLESIIEALQNRLITNCNLVMTTSAVATRKVTENVTTRRDKSLAFMSHLKIQIFIFLHTTHNGKYLPRNL